MAPHEPPVALVTGGAVRVGRAIVEGLVAAGFRVWVHHHRSRTAAETLESTLRSANGGPGIVGIIDGDLADPVARDRLVTVVQARDQPTRGRLDVLVNNAASFERGSFLSRSDADLERVLALNFVAPVGLCRRLALALGHGSVINILDLGAHDPWPERLDHGCAKAALWMATRTLALELAPLRVNAVSPGTVAWPSDLPDGPARTQALARIPLGRIGTPADVAQAVLFLVNSPHVTGQTIVVDGGASLWGGPRSPSPVPAGP